MVRPFSPKPCVYFLRRRPPPSLCLSKNKGLGRTKTSGGVSRCWLGLRASAPIAQNDQNIRKPNGAIAVNIGGTWCFIFNHLNRSLHVEEKYFCWKGFISRNKCERPRPKNRSSFRFPIGLNLIEAKSVRFVFVKRGSALDRHSVRRKIRALRVGGVWIVGACQPTHGVGCG